MAIKSDVLRRIATAELDQLFPGLKQQARDEFATSVVRQWLTYDNNAGVLTRPLNHWLTLTQQGQRLVAGVETCPGSINAFIAPWKIPTDRVPEILHQLTLTQNAVFENEDGERLRLRVNPKERTLQIEPAPDESLD
jgi:hypothetical protein